MSAEIAQFESSLAAEREKEADRQKKMMENLTKRKEELLAEAEKRKQVRLFSFYLTNHSVVTSKNSHKYYKKLY